MKRWLLLPVLLWTACQSPDNFFDRCSGEPLDMSELEWCADTLAHFRIAKPKHWQGPFKYNNENGNSVMVEDTNRRILFSVNELEKSADYGDWDTELEKIQAAFDVRDHGEYSINSLPAHWTLVHNPVQDGPSNWALYFTVEHPTANRFYTITTHVEGRRSVNERLCEIRPLLERFELLP